jgi:hypothetical protein
LAGFGTGRTGRLRHGIRRPRRGGPGDLRRARRLNGLVLGESA